MYLSSKTALRVAVACAVLALVTVDSALAYVGPGAGLSAIDTVLALIGAVLLAIIGFIWYPVKRLLNRNKATDEGTDANTTDPDQP